MEDQRITGTPGAPSATPHSMENNFRHSPHNSAA